MFLKVLQNLQVTPCASLFFNKVAGLRLQKRRLWHRFFPVNFAKSLRIPFLQNTSGGCFCNNFYCRIFNWTTSGKKKKKLKNIVYSRTMETLCIYRKCKKCHVPFWCILRNSFIKYFTIYLIQRYQERYSYF